MSSLSPLGSLSRRLAALDARSRRRILAPRAGVDFASNDYLGLASDPAIAAAIADAAARGVPAGAGGSRLLRGNAPEHEALEEKAARFFGAESALFFSSGFAANAALLATLPQPGDLIVADELIHASVHEGIRLTRAAHVLAAHNDAAAVEDAITGWRAGGGTGTVWIAIESVYSMDGDIAPLADLVAVVDRHGAVLIVDEAHGTGIMGAGGRGLSAPYEGRENIIALHTCGKAMGVEGALVTGAAIVKDYLVNRARGFIFSTAPSPLIAVAVGTAIDRIAAADDRRAALDDLRAHAGRAICVPLGLAAPVSPILPIILGTDRRAMAVAADLQAAGFDIRGIRPPTVPAGTARLRITLTLNITAADIDALAPALTAALAANSGAAHPGTAHPGVAA
ncbi:8-amino-7-oxononanoate synthase [Sphingobium sufflavum]|nr:8-amino-7-oxononanoate synthase [Sphingobium sufflavum]MCE7795538.1 8-amino-7-oxononanoate synthase [Sphingobium sufflavum]